MSAGFEQGDNLAIRVEEKRDVPWHGFGTFSDHLMTVDEAEELSGLDRQHVEVEPLKHDGIEFPGKVAIFDRLGPNGSKRGLHVATTAYKAVQPTEAFGILNGLTGGKRECVETMGMVNGGTRYFACLKFDTPIILDPSGAADRIENYVLVAGSHNGTLGIVVKSTNTRVLCQNTLQWALADGVKAEISFKHTLKVHERMAQAAIALANHNQYTDALEQEAMALYGTKVSQAKVNDLFLAVYPKPAVDAAKAAVTRWEKRFETLWDIYNGPTVANVKGTAWGALNTLTEELDWYRKGRGDDAEQNVLLSAAGLSSSPDKQIIHDKVLAAL